MNAHRHSRSTSPRKMPRRSQQGVVLLEALVAVLIFMIGILGLVGLQATMVKSSSDANYRAVAGYVAQKRLADIWLAPDPSLMAEQNVDIAAESGLPGGLRTTTRNAGTASCNTADCFIVYVYWTPPGGTQHNYTIVSHIDPPTATP